MGRSRQVFGIEVRPSLRNVIGRFAKADKDLLDDKRKSSRRLGRRFVVLAQAEAPQGKTGKFRKSIRFRSFTRGTEAAGFTVTAASPLHDFITEGTKEHPVRATIKGALFFFWRKIGRWTSVPKKGFPYTGKLKNGRFIIGKGFVTIPKRDPNPYMDRAFSKWAPGAETELRRMSNRWVQTVTS